MSWFVRSMANSLKLDDGGGGGDEGHPVNKSTDVLTNKKHEQQVNDDNSPQSPGRGVKEDLSEITRTLTRQLWGVASFLSPSLPPGHSNERSESSDPEASAPEAISGIRRDFAEIGGKFRTGIAKLSNNLDVSEITKMASSFLELESDDDDYGSTDDDGAVGVTDEVVAFATDIAMHPKTWLDFPLLKDENDDEDFDLSDAQQEHALAVERLAPRLGALRIELCPAYMSESSFWKIYFVLLHPRFERHAAELLSTPKIVKVRASLAYELKNRFYPESKKEGPRSNFYPENMLDSAPGERHSVPSSTKLESVPLEISAIETGTPTILANEETEKHPIHSDEIQIVDKSVIQEEPHNQNRGSNVTSVAMEGKDETDDWLKEENSEIVGGRITIPIENDEDVSFSELEDDDDDDDDDGNIPINYKKPTYGSDSSTKDSRGWVQLGRSSTGLGKDSHSSTIERGGSGQVSIHNSERKEPNDWLDVVDIDDIKHFSNS
ncbi:uncharacterized protein LOC112500780 [Cynara cardunculus var. scolymus]|uniref:uncharacterized protein LOC112500780 n=1 Tax=Cynara cardunculus var. scolymus TaxID=59895 RepID=UPI000D6259E4|nr:uncharacterized protein LOC112500780 [Cynara cardunculus var. scolymus]